MDALNNTMKSPTADLSGLIAACHESLRAWGINDHAIRQRIAAWVVSKNYPEQTGGVSTKQAAAATNNAMKRWIDAIATERRFRKVGRYGIAKALIEELNGPHRGAVSIGSVPSRWTSSAPGFAVMTPMRESRCVMPEAELFNASEMAERPFLSSFGTTAKVAFHRAASTARYVAVAISATL